MLRNLGRVGYVVYIYENDMDQGQVKRTVSVSSLAGFFQVLSPEDYYQDFTTTLSKQEALEVVRKLSNNPTAETDQALSWIAETSENSIELSQVKRVLLDQLQELLNS